MSDLTHAWKNQQVVETFVNSGRKALPFGQEQIDIMLRVLLAGVPHVHRFVDLGCGDGILSQALLTVFPEAKGISLDYSEPMLEKAKMRLHTYPQQEVVLKDMSNLSWQSVIDEPVDVVVSGYAIHHLNHGRKYELYEEIYRNLKPGGMFINMEHVASPSEWGENLFDELVVDSLFSYLEELGQSPNTKELWSNHLKRPDKEDNILLSVETQCEWLREIGFYDVECFFKCFEMTIFGGRKPK